MEKIVNIAVHPGTDEETAVNAFRQLHRHASKFGGLSVIFGAGGADLQQQLTRAQNEAVELRTKFSNAAKFLRELQLENDKLICQLEQSRKNADEAEVACHLMQERIAALEAELADLQTNGRDELGIIAQHHAQIEALVVKLTTMKKTLSELEASRELYATEQVAAVRREIERRVRSALDQQLGADVSEPNEDNPQPTASSHPQRKATRKARTGASAKAGARASRPDRGAATERLVLDLLTFEWKSVSILFRSAERRGFTGTENAIRFAAERIVRAGNAVQGHDDEGRIAFRRA